MTKTIAARNAAAPNSPNNAISTLNRPMASQSGTRYEDSTMKRQPSAQQQQAQANAAAAAAAGNNASGGPIYQRVCFQELMNFEHSH